MEPQPHSCVIRGPTIRLPPPLPQDGYTGRQHFVFNPYSFVDLNTATQKSTV